MKILISGGHLTPALALIDYALKQHDQISFAGRLWAQEKTQQQSQEKTAVEQRQAKFIPFSSGKVTQLTPWDFSLEIPRIIWSFFLALKIIRQEKPAVFVSFGGYLAVPLALAAYCLSVPIVTHEQTRGSGLANKLIASFATAVAVSYEETFHFFPSNKTYFVGNPIRRQIINSKVAQPEWYASTSQKPLLYITGGSQGSQVINTVVWQTLPKLVQDWVIIHQCGKATNRMNYKEELTQRARSLSIGHQADYYVREWLSEKELAWVYHHATAIVSRAGANTVQELLLLGKPAIFIPLLDARDDEQTKNAQAVVESGAALLVSQKELNGEKLLITLSEFQHRYAALRRQAIINQNKFDLNADQRLYDLVQKVARK